MLQLPNNMLQLPNILCAETYLQWAWSLPGVFRGTGKPRPPKDGQFEVFYSGRKPA